MIKMTTISSDNETTFIDNTTKNDSDDSGGAVVEAITIFISFMAKTILFAQMQIINYKSKELTTTKISIMVHGVGQHGLASPFLSYLILWQETEDV